MNELTTAPPLKGNDPAPAPHARAETPEEIADWNGRCLQRERRESVLAAVMVGALVPSWIVFDYFLEPAHLNTFLFLRLGAAAAAATLGWLLHRSRTLRAVRLQLVLMIVITGPTIAVMLPQVDHFSAYVFGMSLYFWASGILLTWPVPFAISTNLALLATLAAAFIIHPAESSRSDQVGAFFYLASAAAIGVLVTFLRRRAEQEMVVTQHRLTVALQQLSTSDPLTGLRNRRYVYLTINEDIATAQRLYRDLRKHDGARLANNIDLIFVMMDIDHFKKINDAHGHAAGDRVLQQMQEILVSCCRATDTIARWGGEEFLLILRHTDRHCAAAHSERLLEAVRAHRFDLGTGQSTRVTCSAGFAPYPLVADEAESPGWEKVVELADRCLYAAKANGRDAWIGVVATTLSSAEVTRLDGSFAQLVQNGGLTLRTSFADPLALTWQ